MGSYIIIKHTVYYFSFDSLFQKYRKLKLKTVGDIILTKSRLEKLKKCWNVEIKTVWGNFSWWLKYTKKIVLLIEDAIYDNFDISLSNHSVHQI